jgi:hypothetical protein
MRQISVCWPTNEERKFFLENGMGEVALEPRDLQPQVNQLDEYGEGQPQQNIAHQAPAFTPTYTNQQNNVNALLQKK